MVHRRPLATRRSTRWAPPLAAQVIAASLVGTSLEWYHVCLIVTIVCVLIARETAKRALMEATGEIVERPEAIA